LFSFSGVGKFQAISEPDPILAQEQVTSFSYPYNENKSGNFQTILSLTYTRPKVGECFSIHMPKNEISMHAVIGLKPKLALKR
jgi:hypothetical protein